MTRSLLDRLAEILDESQAAQVMAGTSRWPHGLPRWGAVLRQVRSLIVHCTTGWPTRSSAGTFVEHYTDSNDPKYGLGTQFYLAGDGTVSRLIDLPRLTWHGDFANTWALGVETGNLNDIAPPSDPKAHWIKLADGFNVEGAEPWLRDHHERRPREVIVGWWTTGAYTGVAREPIRSATMLISEQQYRSWGLLARYIAEEFGLPRNLPLLPHASRISSFSDSTAFRRIVAADERFDMLVRRMTAFGLGPSDFEVSGTAHLQSLYAAPAAYQAQTHDIKRHNRLWRALFDVYRGIHGHGFSGNIGLQNPEHDCPGPLFDWHRFARELWDWWWYPFDSDDAMTTTAVPRRPYQRPTASTPLVEYYFDETEVARTIRIRQGVHGSFASPDTFELDPESPIYSIANGELVAARFPSRAANEADVAFVLVRHDLCHQRHPLTQPATANQAPLFHWWPSALTPGAIDYDTPPTSVYVLYMHLGRPGGMDLEGYAAPNPEWLNRLLVRKKECDLGVAFYDDNPQHHGIPTVAWNSPLPGSAPRPTLLDAWRIDRAYYGAFLDALRRGDVAVAPSQAGTATPIRVLLGDFLGSAGVIRNRAGATATGIRVEVFSSSLLPGFVGAVSANGWTPANSSAPPARWYQSEWARRPTSEEATVLSQNGFDPNEPSWWPDVALATNMDPQLSVDAVLPIDGGLWHYRPFDVARWINELSWSNEWRKYEVLDASGQAVPRPPRPRSRRVS